MKVSSIVSTIGIANLSNIDLASGSKTDPLEKARSLRGTTGGLQLGNLFGGPSLPGFDQPTPTGKEEGTDTAKGDDSTGTDGTSGGVGVGSDVSPNIVGGEGVDTPRILCQP